ncbi:4-hydroxybenzoate 3-monooxygenase [Spelaeicoccus albus]|uniref:p-hydroxybenzoate 3-monooxygenase n=1 Tax=Spelaeicoccus albus TaxID=1280376 RepID=A0A7Z0ABE9_9MICO|nr:4-hydroxybenzoate 3-monooxygenase [Spelaeicoccus albus]NYI66755.1 p-hydroxybenzoate 3-monooxygenase [Spelaeicoccus albus]
MDNRSRTQVAIVGAGPAGLLLAHLLRRSGIESVVLENRSRSYAEARIRAGILEQGSVDVLRAAGLGDRLNREGMRHGGIYLQHGERRTHLDFEAGCGRSVWVYGQTEVVKDLIAAADADGQRIDWEISGDALHDVDTDAPYVTYRDSDGASCRVDAAVIAGTDGFHGISRPAIPEARRSVLEKEYPYAWLGILAETAPATDDLIYSRNKRGFALYSMRSREVSRLYLQVPAGEKVDAWSDDRIWDELARRFAYDGWSLNTGPVIDKSVLPMRSFVSAPMRHGNLVLAGDSAHIVPPTGAKGLNLAISDVVLLARALHAKFTANDDRLIDSYPSDAAARLWRATHFSYWMTTMMHVSDDAFTNELQASQLRYVMGSEIAQASLAENYTGMPY